MKKRIILLILYTSTNLITFGQTFSIGRATKELWNPFDIKEIKDFEYHPISYHDSLVIKLEDIDYLDTVSYKLFFTDSGYKKISHFRAGISPKPIVFAINRQPIFGAWIIMPISSSSCNWITCVTNWSEKSVSIQLGYPKTHFKYQKSDIIDPRKNRLFIQFFENNGKLR